MKSVPLNDLNARLSVHRRLIDQAIQGVLDSGWLVLGKSVAGFEAAFAAYVGTSFCVGVGNGTDALEMALKAAGLGPQSRVATVANAGGYTTTALLNMGAEPRFMDVDPVTRNVTLSEVTRALKDGAECVVVTHLYGLAVPEILEIANACRDSGVPLIEDCAQAHGALVSGRRVGTFGDLSCFSFYPTKNLGAVGDGGAVLTANQEYADRLRLLRQYGWTRKYEMTLAGARNSRLDELQAAVLLSLLAWLDRWNDRRREIANRYGREITNTRVRLPAVSGEQYVGHLYVIESSDRSGLESHLRDSGVGTDVHYPVPDHRQGVFLDRFANLSLPVSERLARESLTIPCYPEMTDDQVSYVIEKVNSWST